MLPNEDITSITNNLWALLAPRETLSNAREQLTCACLARLHTEPRIVGKEGWTALVFRSPLLGGRLIVHRTMKVYGAALARMIAATPADLYQGVDVAG